MRKRANVQRPTMRTLEITATMENLRLVLASAAEEMMAAETEITLRQKLFVILEELYNNVALHAYAGRKTGVVRLELLADPNTIQLGIADQGPPFNPLEYDDSQRLQNVLELKEGGEGIFLVKTLATQVDYSYVDSWNRLDVLITA